MPKAPPNLPDLLIQWLRETFKFTNGYKPIEYSGIRGPYVLPLGRLCIVKKGEELNYYSQFLVFRDAMVAIEGEKDVALFDAHDAKFFKKLLPYATYRLSKFGILPK